MDPKRMPRANAARYRFRLSESEVQNGVGSYLEPVRNRYHPLLAYAVRTNNGATKVDSRFIRFVLTFFGRAVDGYPDINGVMANGLALAIECKATGGWPSAKLLAKWESNPKPSPVQARILAQRQLLRMVWSAGGHAGVAECEPDARLIVEAREPLRLWEDA